MVIDTWHVFGVPSASEEVDGQSDSARILPSSLEFQPSTLEPPVGYQRYAVELLALQQRHAIGL